MAPGKQLEHGSDWKRERGKTCLAIISAVRSVSSFTTSKANLGPLFILKLIRFCTVRSFLFFSSARSAGSGIFCLALINCSWSRVVSLIEDA